ncbi:hypothetical protein [Kitasatospora sp. GP82]|uniref:hypothetical protein n=1 Tax=Kitasatospora sp. GP82 TaxID=3035089 RepID=UPI002475D76E|nr:hypothetical protein [Kitasatospora sp. GP82]MDH6128694.1 hypothetical protein [Kitasatospora sp. GP82]
MAGHRDRVGRGRAELGEDEQDPEAVPLPWQARQRYLILRTPEVPELWVRALLRFPASYSLSSVQVGLVIAGWLSGAR